MESLDSRAHFPISVDSVIFGYSERQLKVALIQRKKEPFKGMWAIPGGFMESEESVEETALRELKEETGIEKVYLQQFGVFSKRGRDPRGATITVAFFALIDSTQLRLIATEDASDAQWWPAYELPLLAYDHNEIYNKALEALRLALRAKPLAFELLSKEFTLSELQTVYEQIFGVSLDKRNFRKKILSKRCVISTGKKTVGGRRRPAILYQYDPNIFDESLMFF